MRGGWRQGGLKFTYGLDHRKKAQVLTVAQKEIAAQEEIERNSSGETHGVALLVKLADSLAEIFIYKRYGYGV
jgi:hypothetical protein